MNGVILCLTVLISTFMTSTSLPLKGTSTDRTDFPEQKKETTKVEFFPGSKKEIPDDAGKNVVFLCKSACTLGKSVSSARKGNSSRCQILLKKLSENGKAYKQAFNYCSRCLCNPKNKELSSETNSQKNTQTDLKMSNSFRSPTVTSKRWNSWNSDSQTSDNRNTKDDSPTLRYSQKYNPRSKNSASGFVPVPGPYGFKSSTTQHPRVSQYRSDSYEDDFADRDYHESSYDEEDLLGSGHFEIIRGGIFPYNDDNYLGRGHRGDYTSSYNYNPKRLKARERSFNNRFQYSFPEILQTERRSEITQATNSRGVLARLFAATPDLDTAD